MQSPSRSTSRSEASVKVCAVTAGWLCPAVAHETADTAMFAVKHPLTWRVNLTEGFLAAQQGRNPLVAMPGAVHAAEKKQGQWKRKMMARHEVWVGSWWHSRELCKLSFRSSLGFLARCGRSCWGEGSCLEKVFPSKRESAGQVRAELQVCLCEVLQE